MNISSEPEKLVSLRDRGDLSQAEFDQAKALLLSEQDDGATPHGKNTDGSLSEMNKKRKVYLIASAGTTLAAALSGVSATISPSPVKLVVVLCWVVAAGLWWHSYSKLGKETGKP